MELAWGSVHRKAIDLAKMKTTSRNVRRVLDDVFALFENYEIPATWNLLGHLLLDRCSKRDPDQLPHRDMPRPKYRWLDGDWYKYDPCTDVADDPAWYGKDMIDRIIHYVRGSKVHHEIGCHSFSHQQFGDPECTAELAKAEIAKCMSLLKAGYNISPKTFAFPRDYVGHLEELKKQGFTSFRDIPPKLYPCLKLEKSLSNYLKTYSSLALQLLSYYLLVPPHVVTPKETLPGLVGTPGCLAYGKKSMVSLGLVTFKAMQGINKAIRKGRVFTMYTHLKGFGAYANFLPNFEKVLSHVQSMRDKGELVVKTMSELSRGQQE